jgi:hypothetical protein
MPNDVPARTAWIGGAVGRLGDALLERVVACGYRSVCVLGARPMASAVRGFETADLGTLRAQAGSQRCDDVYLLFDPDPPPAPPHRPQDIPPFAALSSAESTLAYADAAAAAGASRLVLVAPLLAWQQLSAATRLLPEGLEAALAARPIPTMIVMKPTREEVPRNREGSPMQRFVRFYLSQLRFMLPSSGQVIRSLDLARIAVEQLTATDAPGMRVIGLSAIEAAVADHRTAVKRSTRR